MTEHTTSDFEPMESAAHAGKPRSKRRLVLIIVTALGALLVAFAMYAMFVPAPPTPRGMLTATADDDEESGYRQEGEVTEKASVSANATRLESNRNVSAGSSTASTNGDRLFDATIAIYNRNDELLMQRLGLAVFEKLRDSGRFQQVRYLPAGETLPDGERLPEIFVTLEKTEWEESGLPGSRKFEGKLAVTASDRFRRSSHSYSTNLTPPQLSFRWSANIDYSARQTGIETSGARYEAVSQDLAKEILEQLTKLLDDLAHKHGSAGDLPEPFYPEYLAPPDFDFLAALDAQKLVQGPQFMKHCVAYWQIEADLSPQEIVKTVADSLSELGWETPEREHEGGYLRVEHGNEVVEVFRENDGMLHHGGRDENSPAMFVSYSSGMSLAQIDSAIESLFENHSSESALLMFQNSWHRHRELVEKYFQEHSPTSAESWLKLAQLRKTTDPESAREALLRGNALQRIVHQQAADSAMKKLAEELGIEELPSQISPEMIEALGVKNLLEPGEIEVEVHEDEMAVFWIENNEEEQSFLLLTPIHRKGIVPEKTLRFEIMNLLGESGFSRSTMTAGDLTDTDGPMLSQSLGSSKSIDVFSHSSEDGESYQLRLRLDAPE